MNNPNKKRLRRTMMFLNAQKPGLIKDPYIYKADSLMLDLEDAVAENQKDVARFSLYHALKTVDYRGAERVVRINGLDTPYWREDIRACVAGGCDSIRIPKTEHAEDVHRVAAAIAEDEKTYGRPEGEVLIIAALESARGVMNALEICESDERLFGIALSGGDYTKDLQTHITGTGIELMGARQQMIIAARAAGVQCFDTVFTDLASYNTKFFDVATFIDNSDPLQIIVTSTGGDVFKNGQGTTVLTAVCYQAGSEVDAAGNGSYTWTKYNKDGVVDTSWGTNGSKTGKTLSVSSADVDTKATFMVVVAL